MSATVLKNEVHDKGNPLKVLVIGDWVIDEHWVTGIHRSPTSTRTGLFHYRSLHGSSSTVKSFCGAGQVISVINNSVFNDNNIQVKGIGVCHKNDINILASYIKPEGLMHNTPFSISRPCSVNGEEILFNMGCLLKDGEYGTTHVIRRYQNTGSKVSLIERIDWELVPDKYDVWISNKEQLNNSKWEKFFRDNTFDAIIIKDICKGVISETLIDWLVHNFQDKPWFVSTKEWAPTWLNKLKHIDVKLLLLPQVATRSSIKNGILNCWVTQSGYASKESLMEIDKIKINFDKLQNIIVLPNKSMVLTYYYNGEKKHGLLQKQQKANNVSIDVPMASVFFGACISLMLGKKEDIVHNIIKDAFNFTQEWMEKESQRVEVPETWSPMDLPVLNIEALADKPNYGDWHPFPWEHAKKEWDNALSNCGIVKRSDGKLSIEIWRSMTEIDGYVCCVKSKQKVLHNVIEELRSFIYSQKKITKSLLLIASPGSGKTYLVKCMAKTLGFRYLPFNITQMITKADVLECFDTIVTTQAQNPEEPILIFIDEINAKIELQNVYDIFLAPLEEGIFVRGGKTFHINPCVWIFAGTENPIEYGKNKEDKSPKASDFVSRLTISPLNIKNIDETEKEKARVEKVYIGVTLLKTIFPDVRRVSNKVLALFTHIKHEIEIRELKQFVKKFNDIQYGEVKSKNVPTNWLKNNKAVQVDIEDWKKKEEGDMIEIIV
ncbi:MAG: ATP-binding protein [Syntrophales bacterium]|nr:ATP-binding protein [Syntrophales bacterium]